MPVETFKTDFGGRELSVETGKLAGQANGAVKVQYGDTTVLVTATMSLTPSKGDFFPLSVHYEEKYFAAGKIKGSKWIKRETRPSEDAILTARLIDRTLRPRFDHKTRNEVQVVATVLSFDAENDPDIVSMIGASIALMISDIPFDGPIAGCRIGIKEGEFILNPVYKDRAVSDIDLVVAGTEDRINMLEAGSNIIEESTMLNAIEYGHRQLRKIIEFQKEIAYKIGLPKKEVEIASVNSDLKDKILSMMGNKLEEAIYVRDKKVRNQSIESLKKGLISKIGTDADDVEKMADNINFIIEDESDRIIHKNILENNKRPDGRKLDELRKISAEVGILPRTHGTGLFNRGETQALSILTLGAPGLEQWVETMEYEEKKRYFHHYDFPPFSSGETGRVGFTNRREIGHGALAEKAIIPVLPSKEEFPYTIRVVSEILSSNGSTSMASTCGSTLALMDGGVQIKFPVAGISMGLILSESEKDYKILTDIQGPEDYYGDMDLKIAGTDKGITAIQMDVKVNGVTREILEQAFKQSKNARLEILEIMQKTLEVPRQELSPFAPRVFTMQIHPDKIRLVIGPQGKVINEIIDQTGVTIDIEDDGLVFITAENEVAAEKAIKWIRNLTKEVRVGEIFEGRVKKITDFGAFIEIAPGQEGLLHISQISDKRINQVSDILNVGDMVNVKVREIDNYGRVSLTMKFDQTNE